MNNYYVRYEFDGQQFVEYECVEAENEESAIRKTSEKVFESDNEFGSYFRKDSLVSITVKQF